MMRSKRQAVAILMLVFLLGLVSGLLISAVAERTFASRSWSRSYHKDIDLEELSHRLELSAEQKEALAKILERSRQRFVELRAEFKPKVKAIKEQTRAEILQILNDEQKAEFQQLIEKGSKPRHITPHAPHER